MSTLSYRSSYQFGSEVGVSSASTIILIADVKSQFQSIGSESVITSLSGLTDNDLDLIKLSAASKLSPGTDAGASVELILSSTQGGATTLRRVVLGCLPTACSRHNTPARSHELSSLVNSAKDSSASILIILLPASSDNAFAQGVAVARQFPLFSMKSSKSTITAVDVVIHLPTPQDEVSDLALIKSIEVVASNVRLSCRLIDSPPNVLHSDAYVVECETIAAELGCGIEMIRGVDLESKGFGGLWSVGKASEHLPVLVILSHVPAGFEGASSICLVGKGIVYDTGGLSIKTPTTSMAGMKIDMGGSAAVLGSFRSVVQLGLPHRVHALLCIAENSVGPLSTRPDDVYVGYSGKTVEVNNTDAEGRLVLSDGVSYAARNLNPSVIVDIATLTGAQLIATGKRHAAIYCSDEDLESTAVRVGKYTGDLTFPIPYCPEFYRREFKSAVADMKNSVSDRGNAQSSCAAQFIGNHLEDFLASGGKWLHIDCAGPCGLFGDRSTGYGVALLYGLVADTCLEKSN